VIIQLHDIASYMIMLHRGRLTDRMCQKNWERKIRITVCEQRNLF